MYVDCSDIQALDAPGNQTTADNEQTEWINASLPLMRSARGDVRGLHRLTQKRPRTFVSVSALASVAAVGPNTDEQDQLSPDLISDLQCTAGHRAARIRALILIKMPAQFGYPSLSSEGSTFTQSRGGACTAIFSFQQMGLRWPSTQ